MGAMRKGEVQRRSRSVPAGQKGSGGQTRPAEAAPAAITREASSLRARRAWFATIWEVRATYSSTLRIAMKASCGTSTEPMAFMRFLPSFCFSSSLRLREMSPP